MGYEWQLICGFEQMYTFCLTVWLIMRRTYDERMKHIRPSNLLCHIYIFHEVNIRNDQTIQNKYSWIVIIITNNYICLSQ